MAVARRLASYLAREGIQAEVLQHARSVSAASTAALTHVPGDRVAKGVLLRDGVCYLLAVAPASHQVDLDAVESLCGRSLTLADEDEIGRQFPNCEPVKLVELAI
jgi:Ala-tRNA(Pro) deacylase